MVVWCALLIALAAAQPLELPDFDQYHTEIDHQGLDEYDLDLFMELESETGGPLDYCSSWGDTHTRPFMVHPEIKQWYTNVMGTAEWMFIDGPDADKDTGLRKFSLQGTQVTWNPPHNHITVLKDLAVQCGDWSVMTSPPKTSYRGENAYGGRNGRVPTQLFIRGIAKDGTVYDGRNYYGKPEGASGTTIDFGNGDYLKIINADCPRSGCRFNENRYHPTVVQVSNLISVEARCQGVTSYLRTRQYSGYYGGSLSDFKTTMPWDSRTATNPLRCSTQTKSLNTQKGGICGCWNPTEDSKRSLTSKFQACFYLGHYTNGQRKPGTNMGFYDPFNKNNCDEAFKVTKEQSIFALFEYWTSQLKSKDAYDNYESAQPDITVAEYTKDNPYDPLLFYQKLAECKEMLETAVGHTISWSSAKTDARAAAADGIADTCAEDMYDGVQWTMTMAKEKICEYVDNSIDLERKDTFCAFKKLDAEVESLDPNKGSYLALLAKAKSQEDVDSINTLNEPAKVLSEEVSSSLANIDYWFEANCVQYIDDTKDLSNMDCANHEFADTKSLLCDKDPPFPNTQWDGTCTTGQTDGGTCSVECKDGTTLRMTDGSIPQASDKSIQLKCNVGPVDGVIAAKWTSEKTLNCCADTCDGATTYATDKCQDGSFVCADCKVGFKTSAANTDCEDVGCPNFAGKDAEECVCYSGYQGKLSWNTESGKWDGSCTAVDCPPNAEGHPICQCEPGFYGTLVWETTDWKGECKACTAQSLYADTKGQSECKKCKTCSSIEEKIKECSPTTDTICVCKPGYEFEHEDCDGCLLGFTYSDVSNATECKKCTVCNNEDETETSPCTLTSNRSCSCKLAGVDGPCSSVK